MSFDSADGDLSIPPGARNQFVGWNDSTYAEGVRYQIKSRRLTQRNASRQLSAIWILEQE